MTTRSAMPAKPEQFNLDIEGYSAPEILALLDGELGPLLLNVSPITFRAGSAEILASFRTDGNTFVCELAHIDGGGEGVLPALSTLFHRYAANQGLRRIEWIVHAATCATPNLRLQRVLELRGFVRTSLSDKGEVYRLIEAVVPIR